MRLAEYIWVDGTTPSPQLRSKTKVLRENETPQIWGFDGSSTGQAPGESSDCVLYPVYTCPDIFRDELADILVMCEVRDTQLLPHSTNERRECVKIANKYDSQEGWFGIEQEYSLMKNGRPLGFPEVGYPAAQGQYYCSVGAKNTFGREIAEEHMLGCMRAGLNIAGINAEVMPGQWEFQIGGPGVGAVEVSDQLWIARWMLHRVAENYGITVSLEPKPVKGDWNGAGCHTNFSTKRMRESDDAVIEAAEALGEEADLHIRNYGHDIESRLTGEHETCSYTEFRYGVSDRGASIRIPWQCARGVGTDGGYLEDRRPNSNCDPYVVTRLILNTVCTQGNK